MTIDYLINKYFQEYEENNKRRKMRAAKTHANDWLLGKLEGTHDSYIQIIKDLKRLRKG